MVLTIVIKVQTNRQTTRTEKKNRKIRPGLPAFETRCTNCLGWSWKRDANTRFEEHRLEIVWHTFMHDRAVSVSVNVDSKALVWFTPTDLYKLRRACGPHGPSIEMRLELLDPTLG